MIAAKISLEPADRLIVALDFPSRRGALELIERLEGRCGWFKVGLELYLAEGPSIVGTLRDIGFKVFLDLKLHDIPNTVASAVRSVASLGPSLLTVHAAGGPAMLRAAQEAAALSPGLQLLAVTVLTSMDQAELERIGVPETAAQQVMRLGELAIHAGIPGLVCSAQETESMRTALGEDPLLVVPGIRMNNESGVVSGGPATKDDQRRTASPEDAIRAGASMIVVGRPITQAADPAHAVQIILDRILQAGR